MKVILLLMIIGASCGQRESKRPPMASDQFDSAQVEYMRWSDSTNKEAIR